MTWQRLVVVGAMALVVTGCGRAPTTAGAARTPTPSASPSSTTTAPADTASPSPSISSSPSPSPTPCTVNAFAGLWAGRAATSQEEAAMVAVGKPAAEKALGVQDASACSGNQQCFFLGSPSRAMVGTNAGTFYGQVGGASGGGGAACFVFLYRDAAGWHYVNARWAQATGSIPGPQDLVKLSGWTNGPDPPGLSSHIVACLPNGTVVDVDSAPVYLDGHIWWHLSGRGWMAHEFLT